MINRREFLLKAASVGAALVVPSLAHADSAPQQIDFTIDPSRQLGRTPLDFLGFSYETTHLAFTEFFSPRNTRLIRVFNTLTPNGVLRIGGNRSDYANWYTFPEHLQSAPVSQGLRPVNPYQPIIPSLPAPNIGGTSWPGQEPVAAAVTLDALYNLAGFLTATNWSVIWGLNMKTGSAEEAAEEAEAVHRILGRSLLALQFGNEPDLYPNFNYDAFISKWREFAVAVKSRVPNARLAGPDIYGNTGWVARFAEDVADEIVLLSGHYYPLGVPDDPSTTVDHLLNSNPHLQSQFYNIVQAMKKSHLPFRMTETNSTVRGGKYGLSDTLAAALWGGDFLLQLGQVGISGVNFHGGSNRAFAPLTDSGDSLVGVMPLFYGMMLGGYFADSTFFSVTTSAPETNVTAYVAQSNQGWVAGLFNKEIYSPYKVRLDGLGSITNARVWRLEGPSINSSSGVTFAGSQVDSSGSWIPRSEQTLAPDNGGLSLTLPPASAALVFIS